ncbi:MAG: MaoC family dehydratase N-terminal domain-containing protein [Streptosporangiaceae bacterium]|nr:MaoC family dehydratase N-terminal domain-containing protein [Streptosporangiaceae bacterium]
MWESGSPGRGGVADNWQDEWQPLIDAVGTDFGDGTTVWGADVVERGTIRRFAEPLELGSGLHYDPEVARAHGFPDVIAPYTAALSFSVPAMWQPGEPTLYDDPDPDAQPARSPINNQDMPLGPRTTGFFATDIAIEFIRPVVVGERVGRRGRRLVSCTPKQTSMGRGAFLTWESELITDSGDVVARVRNGTYAYNPHPSR